jgi:hypothetical protein
MNLKQLLGICEHKWKQIKEIDVYPTQHGKVISNFFEYNKFVLQCEKCGTIKKKKI